MHVRRALKRTIPRIVALIEHSKPNPDRPRLSPDLEAKLEPIDRRTAACYAGLEELTFRTNELASEIRDDDYADELTPTPVPVHPMPERAK